MTAQIVPLKGPTPPCAVCGGNQAVNIAGVGALEGHPDDRRVDVAVPCLHCVWGIPVVHLAMRGDL